MGDWHFTLFREFAATGPNGPVTRFRDINTKGVLVLLIFFPNGQRRDWLGETLWPGELEEVQRNRLRYALTMARNAVDKGIFEANSNNYLRISGYWTSDIGEWRARAAAALREANASYRVELLEALLGDKLPVLLPDIGEAWADQLRREWDGELEKVLRATVNALKEIRRYERAAHWVEVFEERFPELDPPYLDLDEPLLASDSFIGRREEYLFLRKWLRGSERSERLITITGQGGIGKTRLAYEASEGRPILRVALADCLDIAHAWEALRQALELPPSDTPESAVCQFLNEPNSPKFLLLDNLEQLDQGAVVLVETLLAHCSKVAILATSQRCLDLPVEHQITLRELTPQQGLDLFLACARRERPSFALRPEAEPVVRDICKRLEGIPLAIELAAARASLLGPTQMREQLIDALEFLKTRRPDVPERHRSVRAALDWSVGLLSDSARQTLAQLSVFRGGCGPDAAIAVCGAETLGDLEELKARSLIQVRFLEEDSARYELLSLVREYADQLFQEEERSHVQHKHRDYFVEKAFPQIQVLVEAGKWTEARKHHETDLANVAIVVERVVAGSELAPAVNTWACLAALFFETGYWRLLDDLSEFLLSQYSKNTDTEEYSKILSLMGGLARRRGLEPQATSYWERRLELERQIRGRHLLDTLIDLLSQALDVEDTKRAQEYLQELKSIDSDEPSVLFHQELAEIRLQFLQGNKESALAESRALVEKMNYLDGISIRTKLFTYALLGKCCRISGELDDASRFLVRGLKFAWNNQQKYAIAWVIGEMRDVFTESGDSKSAIDCAFVASELHAELNSRLRAESHEKFCNLVSQSQDYYASQLTDWQSVTAPYLV